MGLAMLSEVHSSRVFMSPKECMAQQCVAENVWVQCTVRLLVDDPIRLRAPVSESDTKNHELSH